MQYICNTSLKNKNKIVWYWFSYNPNAMILLKKNYGRL